MTETEKMLAGKLYDPYREDLPQRRQLAHELCQRYNQTPESDGKTREEILSRLIPNRGKGVWLQGPIQVDFGSQISIGDGSYANFNLVILDISPVTIGKNVFIGPNCSIVTPIHPLCFADRNTGMEYSAPVTIGDNCWLGSNVTVLPGVTIGPGCVIGAGSVVSRSIPAGSLAFGNPCRVVREITQADALENHPEHFA